jgi:hemoglobin-like flavoprotein
MTPGQIKIVQESFTQLAPYADEAGKIFYRRLFELAPAARQLFPADMAEQEQKLLTMLGWIVANLDDVDCLADAVRELGNRHRGYNVADWHYDKVGEALIMAIHDGLGPAFTVETREAWLAAYGVLAALMKEGALTVQRGGSHRFA